MKILIAALLATTVTTHKPLVINHTYESRVIEQVNITNAAMKTYADTPCTNEQVFHKAAVVFADNLNKLNDLIKDMPDNQDTMVEAREVELNIGVNKLSEDIITKQNECIDSLKNKDNNNDNSDSIYNSIPTIVQ